MFLRVLSRIHRPERGWDPVGASYAATHDQVVTDENDTAAFERIQRWYGSVAGKRVLDLGGGPGHFAVAFAQMGADVVWHDVSRSYQRIAEARARAANVTLKFSIGYLDEAKRLGVGSFDLVFNRNCWYYAWNDCTFAALIYSLLKFGGAAYVQTMTPQFGDAERVYWWRHWLNRHFWLKIGYPHPPHARIEALFRRYPVAEMHTDYSSALSDVVFFRKLKTRSR